MVKQDANYIRHNTQLECGEESLLHEYTDGKTKLFIVQGASGVWWIDDA